MGDWQPGDLALCVKGGPIRCPHDPSGTHYGVRFRGGEVRELATVCLSIWEEGYRAGEHCGCVVLNFTDGSRGIASRFRKITPPAADEFDREVIDLMLGGKVEA